ncbi:MAG TPA: tetratricopeptide repeat protein [Myxococcaceae bacterium]
MRPTLLSLLVLAGCAHSSATSAPSSETLATPAALAEARNGWVSSTVRLAHAEVMRGEFERGRTLLGSAIERADAGADAAGKASLQAELALVLAEESFYTRSGTERALQLAAEAQAAARAAGAKGVEARAVHSEGFLRYGELLWADAKDFHVPRELFSRARQLFTEAGEPSGVAQETFFLGLTEEQEKKPERAGALYSEARTLAEKIGDRSTLSYAYRHLGGLAEERGDLDQALDLQRRSLALREEIGFVRLVPFALIAVGDLERKKGLLGDARASYGRALELGDQLKSGPARVWSHFGLGAVDEAEGRLAPALEHYETARRTAEQLGSTSWVEETGHAAETVRKRLGAADLSAPERPGR